MLDYILSFCAVALQAGSFTLDKAALKLRAINFQTYVAVSFPLIFLFDYIIYLIARPPLSPSLLAGTNGLLLLASILISAVTNVVYYRALKKDALTELQTLGMLSAIPVIILTSVLFADERKLAVIIPAVIATLAVLWSHWDKGSLRIKPNTLVLAIWFLIAIPLTASLSKVLLRSWNPISFEMVRDGAMTLLLIPIFWSHVSSHISRKGCVLLIATNLLSSAGWILYFTSYKNFGVVYTGLLFSIQPIIVYIASLIFLGEKFHKKKLIAFFVVLASIIATHFLD